ncbi:MAG: phosphoenolpyruvate carboxykinase [Actinobacteria bacterium]|nr:phosphoenolpyruvate carboxykinase [Actinomycetota bacterium]
MSLLRLDIDDRQVVMHTEGAVCASTQELVESDSFARILHLYVDHLESHNPVALAELGLSGRNETLDLLRLLANNPLERVSRTWAGPGDLLAGRERLHEFVEGLYDFWRRWDRFLVVRADAAAPPGDKRPLRDFSHTVETLARLVRDLYRDVAENVTGGRPRVYRQVAAGAEVGVYAVHQKWPAPARYRELLAGIPFVRNLLMYPPLLLDPPTNTRSGQFAEVADNPLDGLTLEREQWLCYPALVGRLVVFVYFQQRFAGLGLSLANLFEVASDEEIAAGPDAVYLYGVPPAALARFGKLPTVFHDDQASRLLVAAVPLEDRFGYFGYLKKMVLTLHNVAAMDRGVMPFHGAYTRLVLADGRAAGVLIIGDTATGKSETLEALRILGDQRIREVRVIADDMGSLEVAADGRVLGYGTEIGAFVRLDDLQQGYAFGQMDRAIIMSPNRVNARVVLPVTSLDDVLRGYPVDYLLYANNYEAVDDGHPVLERLPEQEAALAVFARGAAMSKGTTTSTGLTSTYFANPFGPAQRPEQHDALARKTFAAAYAAGVYVGQLRTQLGRPGAESAGPRAAAEALLEIIAGGAGLRPPSPPPGSAPAASTGPPCPPPEPKGA